MHSLGEDAYVAHLSNEFPLSNKGTVTWPWWPAVVMDLDSENAPKPTSPQEVRNKQIHLVRFFDGKNGEADDTWYSLFVSYKTSFADVPYIGSS